MGYINIIISPIIIQHEEEEPHTVGVGGASEKDASQKLSKSALKNKRKRESKLKAKEEEVRV